MCTSLGTGRAQTTSNREERVWRTSSTAATRRRRRQRRYAHPEVLVDTEWVAQHLDDPQVRIVEADEDPLLYEVGHIQNAVKLDWHTDVQDPVRATS